MASAQTEASSVLTCTVLRIKSTLSALPVPGTFNGAEASASTTFSERLLCTHPQSKTSRLSGTLLRCPSLDALSLSLLKSYPIRSFDLPGRYGHMSQSFAFTDTPESLPGDLRGKKGEVSTMRGRSASYESCDVYPKKVRRDLFTEAYIKSMRSNVCADAAYKYVLTLG